jgi:hypothetical protein
MCDVSLSGISLARNKPHSVDDEEGAHSMEQDERTPTPGAAERTRQWRRQVDIARRREDEP